MINNHHYIYKCLVYNNTKMKDKINYYFEKFSQDFDMILHLLNIETYRWMITKSYEIGYVYLRDKFKTIKEFTTNPIIKESG